MKTQAEKESLKNGFMQVVQLGLVCGVAYHFWGWYGVIGYLALRDELIDAVRHLKGDAS